MTNDSKAKIKILLDEYCNGFSSQAKAANSLKNVSAGTVSQIRNNNWALIADSMWISVGKQVGFRADEWINVETTNYCIIQDLLMDAKVGSRVHALIGRSSWGKDTGLNAFKSSNKDVYQVNCNDELTVKYLIAELLESMGEVASGTAYKMAKQLVAVVSKMESPLIILNEYEKLNQKTFKYFITLFNLLEHKCGIVLSDTPSLKTRVDHGVKFGKPGYDEIFSRIGGRFISLKMPSKRDVSSICTANGVTDPAIMAEIYNDAAGDLRRVKKLVQNQAQVKAEAA